MRRTLPLAALPLLLALATPVPADEAGAGVVHTVSTSSGAVGFGAALNVLRGRHGLGELRPDRELQAAAAAHAEDMARHGYHSHHGRDGSRAVDRARRAGCSGGYVAENIAWGQPTGDRAFQGWAASPPHYRNMVGRPYAVYGLAEAGGMWVLMFADRC